MKCSRRIFIKNASTLAIALAVPNMAKAAVGFIPLGEAADMNPRTLSFYNIHTRENLQTCYFNKGKYQIAALKQIYHILRDRRTGEIHSIDLRLLNLLNSIKKTTNSNHPFHVISGYRSPATNAMLYRTTKGVDKNSYHMKGRAIDIRLPGFKTRELREVCVDLEKGGVGYYPKSDFVHVDTGPIRTW